MKSEKVMAEDLEPDMAIWVRDDGQDKMKLISSVQFNLNNQAIITFDDGTHIMVKLKKKFELV